jgi:ribosome assembly protein YihI (activator of Der GTPase)
VALLTPAPPARLLGELALTHPELTSNLAHLVEAYESLASALAMHEDTDDEQDRVEQLLDALGIDVDENGHAHVRG